MDPDKIKAEGLIAMGSDFFLTRERFVLIEDQNDESVFLDDVQKVDIQTNNSWGWPIALVIIALMLLQNGMILFSVLSIGGAYLVFRYVTNDHMFITRKGNLEGHYVKLKRREVKPLQDALIGETSVKVSSS